MFSIAPRSKLRVGLPVLVYGNKQDVDGAANEEDLKKTMNLNGDALPCLHESVFSL